MVRKSPRVRWGKFTFTEDEIERQIAEATRRGTDELQTEPLATAVRFEPRTRRVVLELNKGTTLTAPVDLLQGVSGAAACDLAQVELVGPGVAIEWPTLDQQFSVRGLLDGIFGTPAWMAKLARRNLTDRKRAVAASTARPKSSPRRKKKAATLS